MFDFFVDFFSDSRLAYFKTKKGREVLKQLKNDKNPLQELALKYAYTTPSNFHEEKDFSPSDNWLLAEILKNNKTLKSIRIEGYYINSSLLEVLKTCISLQHLKISGGSYFDKADVKELAEILTLNTTLQTFEICYKGIETSGISVLANGLPSSGLQVLNLSGNLFYDEGAQALAQGLSNVRLRELWIARTGISWSGVQTIVAALALESNSSLQLLDLSGNEVADNGVELIVRALQYNCTLQTLSLSWCNIADRGAQLLAGFLGSNSTLLTLGLFSNQIGADGTKALFNALKINGTLQVLDINESGYNGTETIQTIIESIKYIMLEKLAIYVSNANHPDKTKELFEELEKSNYSLTYLGGFLPTFLGPDYLDADNSVAIVRNRKLRDQLQESVKQSDISEVARLAKQRVSLLSRNEKSDNTILHEAVLIGNHEMISFLISLMQERRIPLTIRNADGKMAKELTTDPKVIALFPTDTYSQNQNRNVSSVPENNNTILTLSKLAPGSEENLQNTKSIISEQEQVSVISNIKSNFQSGEQAFIPIASGLITEEAFVKLPHQGVESETDTLNESAKDLTPLVEPEQVSTANEIQSDLETVSEEEIPRLDSGPLAETTDKAMGQLNNLQNILMEQLKQQTEAQTKLQDQCKVLEQKPYSDSDSALVKIQQQLDQINEQHQELWLKHQAAQAKLAAAEAFKQLPNCWEYYRFLLIRLEEVLMGGVKPGATNFFAIIKTGKAGKAAGWTEKAEKVVEILLPFVGDYVNKISLDKVGNFLRSIDKERQKNTFQMISQRGTYAEMEIIAEAVARQLTDIYQDSLQKPLTNEEVKKIKTLPDDSLLMRLSQMLKAWHKKGKEAIYNEPPTTQIQALADLAMALMISTLFAGLDDAQSLEVQLVQAVTASANPKKRSELQQEILLLFKDTFITTNNQRLITADFYNKSGIRTKENKYFAGGFTEPDLYGYRLGTEEEAKALELQEVPPPVHQVAVAQQPHPESANTIFTEKNVTNNNSASAINKAEVVKSSYAVTIQSMQSPQAEMPADEINVTNKSEIEILKNKFAEAEVARLQLEQELAEMRKMQQEFQLLKKELKAKELTPAPPVNQKVVGNEQWLIYEETTEHRSVNNARSNNISLLKQTIEIEQRVQKLEQSVSPLVESSAHTFLSGTNATKQNLQMNQQTITVPTEREERSKCCVM